MCDNTQRTEQLIGYLYDDIEPADRQAFEAHLSSCAQCRAELAAFRATQGSLAAWVPPEPGMGLRMVRGGASMPPPAEPARRPAVWALAAAAALVLSVSAAIANLEVRVGGDGLVVRTGRGAVAPMAAQPVRETAPAPVPAAVQSDMTLEELLARLDEIEAQIVARGAEAVPAGAPQSARADADLLRRVRSMVTESENRQQREFRMLLSGALREFDRLRRQDIAMIQYGMSQHQGLTSAEIDRLNQQLVRVAATREEK